MYKLNCKYCGDIELESSAQAGGHVVNCKKNPDRYKTFEKMHYVGRQLSRDGKTKRIAEYNQSPKICINCNKSIPYEKKHNIYCSKNCSASYNNKKRGPYEYKLTDKGRKSLQLGCQKMRLNELKKDILNPDRVTVRKLNIIEKLKKERVPFNCPVCGKILMITLKSFKEKKYCSGTCRNKINNKIIRGVRSKAEKYLENQLSNIFPDLKIKYNDRTLLDGKELDVYIPKINLAVEWNGIFHFKKMRDNHSLSKIKQNDLIKLNECKKLQIDLYVVKDLTSNNRFIKEETDKIIILIKNKLGQLPE